ncbi:MAG: hypothetical protein ACTSRA_04130 [Promethearchaeota archaeon]
MTGTEKNSEKTEDVEEIPLDETETGGEDKSNNSNEETKLSKELQQALEQEFKIMQYFDVMYANPLIFVHSKKNRTSLLKKINQFFETRPKAKEYWSKPENDLVKNLNLVLDNADKFAREKGLASNPQTKAFQYLLIIFSAFIGSTLLLYVYLPSISTYISWGGICVLCCISQTLTNHFAKKLRAFQVAHASEFVERYPKEMERIHDAAQYFLEDIHQTMLASGIDVSKYTLQLFNSDYKNIQVLDTRRVPNLSGFVYIVRFLKEGEDQEEFSAKTNSDVDFEIDSDESEIEENDNIDDLDLEEVMMDDDDDT